MHGAMDRIIVIGGSAGALDACDRLIAQLPSDLPASIFVVQHMSAENTGEALLQRLGQYGSFQAKLADDQEEFKSGRIYIARPDFHLLIKSNRLLVTKGARENRFRPGIDPLFRSAAVNHGPSVIGVVLTGMLNDGTAGLEAIKRCGGVTVVQDPKDATYPDMPKSALANVTVDYCVPVAEMGALLERLIAETPHPRVQVPKDIKTEAEIAERVLSDVAQVNTLGEQVPYNCPNCGGVLWKVEGTGMQRYRCHTGHSYTALALLTSQSERIEETLWTSLRMFEEQKNLLNTMAASESSPRSKANYKERVTDLQVHIQRIRAMLNSPGITDR